jgi:cytochrome c oxidase subunit 1
MSNDKRTCDITGLKIDKTTEGMIKLNITTAIIFLAIGGAAALLVLLTRWPAIHLLPVEWYYRWLTAHGLVALIVWIFFFEVALVYLGSVVLLGGRMAVPILSKVSYGLMMVGTLMVVVMVLGGQADVLFTSYVPLQAHPLYYLGIILVAVGMLIVFIHFFINMVVAKKEGAYKKTLPLVSFGIMAGSIIGIMTLAHGAAIYIPTLLWSLGVIETIDPSAYRLVWWGLGHSSQQVNVCLMVSMWYMTAAFMFKAKPLSEKLCRTAFVLYILFINVASEHHLLVDPTFSAWHKIVNTSYVLHLAVLASMIHAFAVPASFEIALRKKGYTNGLFEWLKKAPWGNPGFSAIFISIMLFGFLGGITGVIFGTEQFSIIRHNTWAITGHFHGTVVAGTTIAFMGAAYQFIPIFFKRDLILPVVAKFQPYVYGGGIMLMSIAMMSAGSFGVPRRHWDYNFSDAPFGYQFDSTVDIFMGLTGLGGVIAVVGGAMFIVVTLGSIFAGPKRA